MKKVFPIVVFCLLVKFAIAQSVGIGTTTPAASAQLDISSINKGMLVPRMTTTQRDAITSPANSLFIYNTTTKSFNYYETNTWKEVGTGALPTGAIVLSETKHDPAIEAAGFTYSGYMENNINITEELPVVIPANTWYQLNQSEPDNFSGPTNYGDLPVFWDGNNALIISPGMLYSYNPITDKYTDYQLANPPAWSDFIDATFTYTGTQVLEFSYTGGFRLDIANKSWTSMSTTNSPTKRKNHSAVWTGSKLIIWGGNSNSFDFFNVPICLDDGSLYDPATNTWTPISPGGLLTGKRELHSAIWDGTEMIVFGGRKHLGRSFTDNTVNNFIYDSVVYYSGGFKYNPVTNAYSIIAPSGIQPRVNHSAVWTGTEMVVWGGESTINKADYTEVYAYTDDWGNDFYDYPHFTNEKSHSYYNTGAKYNPVSNTWTTLPVPQLLTACTELFSVWDGIKIIYISSKEKVVTTKIVNGKTVYTYTTPQTGQYLFPSYYPTSNTWDLSSVSSNFYVVSPSEYVPKIEFINYKAVWAGDKILVFNDYNYGFSTTEVNLVKGQTGVPKRYYLYKKN